MKTILIVLSLLPSFLANLEQRTFQTDFTVTVAEAADAPMNYPGTITTHGEQFLLTMFGVEAAYDGQTLYMYNADTDELTLSNPTKEELVASNPFLYARTIADACTVTERANGEETIITLTPKANDKMVNRFVLKVRTADLMPLHLEMREGQKTTTLRLTNPRFITTEPQYIIRPEASTYVNDMRF